MTQKNECQCPKLYYSEGQKIEINGEFILPVPDGFKTCTDKNIIGEQRRVTVVPADYSVYADPMEAPVALSIQTLIFPCCMMFYPELADLFKKVYSEKIGYFSRDYPITYVNLRPGCGFLCQQYYDVDDPSWNKAIGLIFANRNAYLTHIIFNHDGYNSSDFNVAAFFTAEVNNWMSQISLSETEKSSSPASHFPLSAPGSALYPHYGRLKNHAMPNLPGVNFVVNQAGMEFEFISAHKWKAECENIGISEDLIDRIIDSDTGRYNLYEKAEEMIPLFRVDPSVFDSRHDRECELLEGYMHRAYMLNGLRSFGWTAMEYCHQKKLKPEELDLKTIIQIVDFCAQREWLNYRDNSWCPGLCEGSDLHVYFLPNAISAADRRTILPSQEDRDRIYEIQKKFPDYNEILPEVHSLNALRCDLETIYPMVRKLWEDLKESRNPKEPLLGNTADVVYAWCAVASAARQPFYTEDGPSVCCFKQRTEAETEPEISGCTDNSDFELKAREAFNTDLNTPWLNLYRDYIDINPDIRISGQLFVFSGLDTHSGEKNHPFVQKIIAKGGEYRGKVSGLTNYLVIASGSCGKTKIEAAIEQKKKRKNIQIILIPDLLKALDEKQDATVPKSNMTDISPASSGKIYKNPIYKLTVTECKTNGYGILHGYSGTELKVELPDGIKVIAKDAFKFSDLEEVVIPEGVQAIECGAFNGCNFLKKITFPSTLEILEPRVFRNCNSLKTVSLPEGLTEIGENAFVGCCNLKNIYLPSSLQEIEEDAFCTLCSETVLHVPKGSLAEIYAEKHKLKFDHRKLPPKPVLGPRDEEHPFVVSGDGVLECYQGKKLNVIIPPEVKIIGENAFQNEIIKSVVIPEGVEEICSNAFCSCKRLTEVMFPSTLKKIGNSAFEGTALRSIEIPDNVEELGYDVFKDCTKLKSVKLSGRIKQVPLAAFAGSSLEKIDIPYGTTTVCCYAFYNCRNLKEISLPESLQIIEHSAFTMAKLKKIVINEGVTEIQKFAFSGCYFLQEIYLPESLEKISEDFIGDIDGAKIYVVKDSPADAYFKNKGVSIFYQDPLTEEQREELKNRRLAAAEQERLRIEAEEMERRKKEEEAIRLQKEAKKAERLRKKQEKLKRQQELEEAERQKREKEEAEQRSLAEKARKRRELIEREQQLRAIEIERQKKLEEEEERFRRQQEAEEIARRQEEENRRRQEELQNLRSKYDSLSAACEEQRKLIDANKGIFGKKARIRKMAQSRLERFEDQLHRYFPNGRP